MKVVSAPTMSAPEPHGDAGECMYVLDWRGDKAPFSDLYEKFPEFVFRFGAFWQKDHRWTMGEPEEFFRYIKMESVGFDPLELR